MAFFMWDDGRPFAELHIPDQPLPPMITADERAMLEVHLERWVRERWHTLMRASGIHYDRGALPTDEPNPRYRTAP